MDQRPPQPATNNWALWQHATITKPDRFEQPIHLCNVYRPRYEAFAKPLGIPWWFVAVLHCREADFNFHTHLHNGDPLTARTVHVPKGRPVKGMPPFDWEFSAKDALAYEGFLGKNDWSSLPAVLDRLENFNGRGYAHKGLPTPYLWAGTSVQKLGKFTSDGHFDPAVMDSQPGCAGILKLLGIKE